VNRLDNFNLPGEELVQLLQQREVDAAMKLYGGQAGLLGVLRDAFCRQSGKDTYALNMGGKMRSDACDLGSRYLALAGREDKANGVGTKGCGQLCVG
jgi:hypothetical protein